MKCFGRFGVLPEWIATNMIPSHHHVSHIKQKAASGLGQEGLQTESEGVSGIEAFLHFEELRQIVLHPEGTEVFLSCHFTKN